MQIELLKQIKELRERGYKPTTIINQLNISDDDYLEYLDTIEFFINDAIQIPKIEIMGNFNDVIKDIELLSFLSGYLYAISFPPDRIKIGRSDRIDNRIKQHNKQIQLYSNNQIEKVAIIGPFQNVESKEIMLLNKIAESQDFKLIYGREWFIGDFDKTIELVTNFLHSLYTK